MFDVRASFKSSDTELCRVHISFLKRLNEQLEKRFLVYAFFSNFCFIRHWINWMKKNDKNKHDWWSKIERESKKQSNSKRWIASRTFQAIENVFVYTQQHIHTSKDSWKKDWMNRIFYCLWDIEWGLFCCSLTLTWNNFLPFNPSHSKFHLRSSFLLHALSLSPSQSLLLTAFAADSFNANAFHFWFKFELYFSFQPMI